MDVLKGEEGRAVDLSARTVAKRGSDQHGARRRVGEGGGGVWLCIPDHVSVTIQKMTYDCRLA